MVQRYGQFLEYANIFVKKCILLYILHISKHIFTIIGSKMNKNTIFFVKKYDFKQKSKNPYIMYARNK